MDWLESWDSQPYENHNITCDSYMNIMWNKYEKHAKVLDHTILQCYSILLLLFQITFILWGPGPGPRPLENAGRPGVRPLPPLWGLDADSKPNNVKNIWKYNINVRIMRLCTFIFLPYSRVIDCILISHVLSCCVHIISIFLKWNGGLGVLSMHCSL